MTTNKEQTLLRFATTGSVDDGKSTLIGRLLYETKTIFEDQYAAIEKTSRKKGMVEVDLALLLDGLSAEREQGITIDVVPSFLSMPATAYSRNPNVTDFLYLCCGFLTWWWPSTRWT